jgi:hypothetical protein
MKEKKKEKKKDKVKLALIYNAQLTPSYHFKVMFGYMNLCICSNTLWSTRHIHTPHGSRL